MSASIFYYLFLSSISFMDKKDHTTEPERLVFTFVLC